MLFMDRCSLSILRYSGRLKLNEWTFVHLFIYVDTVPVPGTVSIVIYFHLIRCPIIARPDIEFDECVYVGFVKAA